jgi:hypothetical protein
LLGMLQSGLRNPSHATLTNRTCAFKAPRTPTNREEKCVSTAWQLPRLSASASPLMSWVASSSLTARGVGAGGGKAGGFDTGGTGGGLGGGGSEQAATASPKMGESNQRKEGIVSSLRSEREPMGLGSNDVDPFDGGAQENRAALTPHPSPLYLVRRQVYRR